ncbi:exosome component 10-like [Anneissia japonica]|uniref:exosome component 10-like n=1 Tax=Anneissia japonica TaxID=1529436 RepID=UPI0014257904|nr:exosome component 10-like [Anneissia japonica]
MEKTDDASNEPSCSTLKKAIEPTQNLSQDVNVYAQKGLGLLVKATKAANGLPAAGDEHEYYSSFESFRHFRQNQSKKLLARVNTLLRQNGIKGKLDPSKGQDVEEMMDMIIEANDIMLERVGIHLDTASGVKKSEPVLPTTLNTPKVVISSWNRKSVGEKKSQTFHLMQAKNIQRPQLSFKTKVDNKNTPFVPIIKVKPNARQPLNVPKDDVDISLVVADFVHQERHQEVPKQTENICAHPYKYELEHLEFTQEQLLRVEKPEVLPLQDTPLTFIDTVEGLEDLTKVLNESSEFAVDLEAHTYRSFLGFICLMQFSTGKHDYLVDALALRSELHILNQPFTDPKIVKVFHGANMDVVWLQRDFGVYIVNMFDTGQASRVLGLAKHSLAYLLKMYCDVDAAKEYQLADWRIRPMPDEMKKYAREDTHYLLYIYHIMKNTLLDRGNNNKNLLQSTLERSKEVCLKRFEKPIIKEDSHLEFYRRSRKTLNKKQLFAFKLLFAWRDSIARTEDESLGYVLPSHMLFHIAENLPREPEGILACCNPTPPLVRQYLAEIHTLVVQARMHENNLPKTSEKQEKDVPTFKPRKIEPLESLIHCPHDTTHRESTNQLNADERKNPVSVTGSSTLFGGGESHGPPVRMAEPIISVFGNQDQSLKQSVDVKNKVARIMASLKSPFELYLPSMKPTQIASTLLSSNKIEIPAVKTSQHKPSPVAPNNPSPYVWKLKKAEEKPEILRKNEVEATNKIGGKREWRQKEQKEGEDEEQEEDEPLQPLRKKKQRKGQHYYASSSSSVTSVKMGDERLKEGAGKGDEVVKEGSDKFQAYDYSQTDYSTFSGGNKHQKDAGKQFDPSRVVHKFKGGNKSRTNPRSGKRSFTYNQQSNQAPTRKKWPKR